MGIKTFVFFGFDEGNKGLIGEGFPGREIIVVVWVFFNLGGVLFFKVHRINFQTNRILFICKI